MEQMSSKPLADIIKPGLTVLFIGYNPSPRSAEQGHHYAGRNNRFWELLFRAGLTPEKLDCGRDMELLNYGYGSTNIVERPTKSADQITREEYLTGRVTLKEILAKYKPKIACYVGIGVYKAFAGKTKVSWGLQEGQLVPGVRDFVAPSSSGLNRMSLQDQVAIYRELKDVVGPEK